MSSRWLFTWVGILAALAGTGLWIATRPGVPGSLDTGAAPAALFAASFKDTEGRSRSLGEFHGKVVVLNFWATWCAPCRDEMPAFQRLQARWSERGVQFVGLSAEDGAKVAAFARGLGVRYPLWVGGDEVGELSRRLGNRDGVLPHTVILSREGHPISGRVGTYKESDLEKTLEGMVPNVGKNRRT